MSAGSRQDQRLPPALQAGFVLPDELGLDQRIRATLELSRRLAFVDPSGRVRGNWGQALDKDESAILADIAGFPLESQRDAFLAALASASPEALVRRLWGLVDRVDRWLRLLRSAEGADGQALARLLASEVEGRLGPPLRAFLNDYGQALVPSPDQLPPHALSPDWNLRDEGASGEGLSGRDQALRETLRNLVLSFVQSIGVLKIQAHDRLASSFKSGGHDPAAGLLLAFLQLHEAAQGPLNRFPQRLTDFYYQDILGMLPRPAALEKAYLLLAVEPTYKGLVTIDKGMRFVGGKDAQGAAIEFAADQACRLSNAQISALCTLNLERDPLVSPERELGFASRAKAQWLTPVDPAKPVAGPKPAWSPLFGSQSGASHSPDARLGFALSSPLFELKEGTRELTVILHLSRPSDRDSGLLDLLRLASRPTDWLSQVFTHYLALEDGVSGGDAAAMAAAALKRNPTGDPYLRFLVALCLDQQEAATLTARLGKLFTVWLTSTADLVAEDLAALKTQVHRILDAVDPAVLEADDPLTLVFSERPPERGMLFDRVFQGLWSAKLSVAAGWLSVADVFCRLREPEKDAASGAAGIELQVQLGPDAPALAPCTPDKHGPQWPAQAALSLELQSQTRVFGYSLLSQLEWKELELKVSVQGLRNVLVYNQMGPLDPSKPFQAFGPLPTQGSYCVLGSEEMAAKPLLETRVRLEWGNLPNEAGGFEQHYQGYPGTWDTGAFQARPALLRDGQWQAATPLLPLFASVPGEESLTAACTLDLKSLDLPRNYQSVSANAGAAPFAYGPQARSGFFRLELAQPAQAFGHALYPRLLTETLTRNARLKGVDPLPLPLEPYTPVVQSLQLDYRAGLSIYAGQDQAADSQGAGASLDQHRVFQLYPFGIAELIPGRLDSRRFLIPPLDHDGNLCIGVQSAAVPDALSLFFDLCPEAAAEPDGAPRPALRWAVWRGDGWMDLPPWRVLSDSTLGFLRPGIVSLDLPSGMSKGCPFLPGSLYWLRVSADRGFDGFAGLYGVHINAVSVTRVQPPDPSAPLLPLPAGSIQAPLKGLPGLLTVSQSGPTFGLRAADGRQEVLVRSGERLRHKRRASTAWDYERLLLDAFPELVKVRAFPHLGPDTRPGAVGSRDAPGQVLVVVVPSPGVGADPGAAPRVDAASLESMQATLSALAPPGARVVLRNASYERIQVRCSVSLIPGAQAGPVLNQLGQAVSDFLSPWQASGPGPVFGWEVRAEELEALLRANASVASVGGLSLLHLAGNDQGFYLLDDSAAGGKPTAGIRTALARPALPWSLLLPTRDHLIEAAEGRGTLNPLPTGVGLLEVGNTFIINRPKP